MSAVSHLRKRIGRNARGAALAEGIATLAWFVPLVVLAIFVVVEVTRAYIIMRDLQVGAALAARALASSGSTTTSAQQGEILQNVKVANTVVDPSQFYSVQWQPTQTPPVVTVFVQYKSTGNVQPPAFPDPDPLRLGSQFAMQARSTYRLMH